MIAAIFEVVPVLALEGEPKGWGAIAFVLWWVVMLMGSTYALLWAIYGAKQALHVLMASTWAFMILYSAIWLFGAPGTPPGTGPRGREPAWIPFLATSEQAQDFSSTKKYPADWEVAGRTYPGGIESGGEAGNVKRVWQAALAERAASQGTAATKPADWNFRIAREALTDADRALPFAEVRFKEDGGSLLAAVTIPSTDKHPETTVFAFRDKGQVFYWAAISLGVSIVLFAAHLLALAQIEKKQQIMQGAPA